MSNTISGSTTIGITLASNPTTIHGTINSALGPAIYGGTGTDWTIDNFGLLETKLGASGGIYLRGQGHIYNAASAVITAYPYGIHIGQSATIVNAGEIISHNDYGNDITLPSGQLINLAGGLISGGRTAIKFGPGTNILNQGTILSTNGYGLTVYGSGGLITNASGATIAGQFASVELTNADTLINAGLITTKFAGSGTAVAFGDNEGIGTGTDNLLVLEPGSNIMGAIAGFIAGDTIDFASASITGEIFANNVLTLSNESGVVATLALPGDFNSGEFVLSSDHAGGTAITLGSDIVTGTYGSGINLTALQTTITAGTTITNSNNVLTGSGAQAWTVVNAGSIENTGALMDRYGVLLNNFALFDNAAGGLIAGGTGAVLRGEGGVFINAGTVIGENGLDGIAIQFSPGPAYRPDHPGYGARYIDAARNVTVRLEPGSKLGGAIGGFDTGNTIDVAGIVANHANFANGILTLSNHGTEVAALKLDGNFNNAEIGIFSDHAGGTDITLASREVISGTYNSGLQLSAPVTQILKTALISNGPVFSEEGRYITLVNAGQISDSDSFGVGVDLQSGRLTNTGNGTITAGHYGVQIFYGTLINAGSIGSTGSFSGASGFHGGSGAELINTGMVTGLSGATLFGASVDNKAGGVIAGAVGITMLQGTLTNAGTIASTSGAAGVAVSSSAGATVIVDPDAVFIGKVVAQGGQDDVLELSGSSATPLKGIGTQFSGFDTIAFAPHARWHISGDSAGLAAGQEILGFKPGDAITLTDAASGSGSVTVATNGVVTIHAGKTSYALQIAGAYAGERGFSFSNSTLTEQQPGFLYPATICSVLAGDLQSVLQSFLQVAVHSAVQTGFGHDLLKLVLQDFAGAPGNFRQPASPLDGPAQATLSSGGTAGALGAFAYPMEQQQRQLPVSMNLAASLATSLATHGPTTA